MMKLVVAGMNDQDRHSVAKIVSDLCGSLACASVGFAVFAIILSFTIKYYEVDMGTVVSVMVGVALACFFTRVALLLQYSSPATPNDVFRPLVVLLVMFVVLGSVIGWIVQHESNTDYRSEMCYRVVNGLEPYATSHMIKECPAYRDNVQQLFNGVLGALPLGLVIALFIHSWLKFSRWGVSGAAILR